jgi:hypothetical protein
VNCAGVDRRLTNSSGVGKEICSLEAYAQAVRAYQDAVLELQRTSSNNPEVLGAILERAAAAKQAVNRYRGSYRAD